MGSRLLVRHGEVVSVDGTLSGPTGLDESTLTGESLTRHRLMADAICSGVLNVGAAFEVTASASAEKSTLAGVVRLVSTAQSERSPFVRLADQYAFALGGVAVLPVRTSWILTDDSTRYLIVLVAAMPRPLILAVPVAIVSGLSRCAKRSVLVKGGGALKRLALADMLFFNRTGTPASGFVRLVSVECAPHYASDVAPGLTGSVIQASNHVTAEAVAKAAHEQGAKLWLPSGIVESPGAGVCGRANGRVVSIGLLPYVLGSPAEPSWVEVFTKRVSYAGASAVFVGVNDELVGALQLIDHVRLEAPHALRPLRQGGIKRQAVLTGDRANATESVGSMLGVAKVRATPSPAAKLAVIQDAHVDGEVIVVDDGVNNTPAFAAADVGVAIDVRGATASSGATDIVLLVDRPDRLVSAVWIVHRTHSAALQSMTVGMSLSLVAVVAAALGHLPPLTGTMLQEPIDVLTIASVLRAPLLTSDEATRSLICADTERFKAEHVELEPILSRIRLVADALPHMGGSAAGGALLSLNQSLADILVPYECRDDTQLYLDIVRLLGEDGPMVAIGVMHREIFRMMNPSGRIAADVSVGGPDAIVTQELQHLLYGLDAILRLYCAQEGELFHVLGGEA